jgi:hypothetical protein
MKIKVEGKEVEAYNLLMRKEYAMDIVSGKKTLEIREFKSHYVDMFTDKEQLKKNEELRKAGRVDECVEPFKSVSYVRFHNYDYSWILDVKIDEIGLSTMCQEDIEELAEAFNFHDYDKEWQQFEHLEDDEKPLFYWLHIKEIVSRKGI